MGRFTVIGMDQRNAGNSKGAVTETHGWHAYASDHLALMDHLGHRRFHVKYAHRGTSSAPAPGASDRRGGIAPGAWIA